MAKLVLPESLKNAITQPNIKVIPATLRTGRHIAVVLPDEMNADEAIDTIRGLRELISVLCELDTSQGAVIDHPELDDDDYMLEVANSIMPDETGTFDQSCQELDSGRRISLIAPANRSMSESIEIAHHLNDTADAFRQEACVSLPSPSEASN